MRVTPTFLLLLVLAGCDDDPDRASDTGTTSDTGDVPDIGGSDATPDVPGEPDSESDPALDTPGEMGSDVADADVTADTVAEPDVDDGLVGVVFVVTVPASTPPGASVFIAGNFQDWNPGDPTYELEPADGLYEIALRFEPGTALEFKFTRGDWTTVEKGPNGEEIANRQYTVDDDERLELTVARWADGTPSDSTITGDVSQITVPGFLDGRRVWVYLPPDYDETTADYPVLYMFDGQNVFDQATSFAGEWEVDESCEALIADGEMAPIIVVAVDNGGGARIDEYTPWSDPGYGGGEADDHLDAFVETLVPYVDSTYRTIAEAGGRALSGSSLGGLVSLYAAYTRDDTFGAVAALSPSLWWDDEHLTELVAEATKPDVRIYTDMGTRESGSLRDDNENGVDDHIDRLRALRAELLEQGFVEGDDLMVVEDEGATHSEPAWAARFPDALQFLFPAD